jgi:hypothetical protein
MLRQRLSLLRCGGPENVKSDISDLQILLDTMKGNLHAAPLISIERYSQKRK